MANRPVRVRSGKQYINVTLPGPSKFTPIILSATPEKTIFARVGKVNDKRDIQVLQGSGDRWDFVGSQGQAVTGEDGNFLNDAVQGPDGRLWILVAYTAPSNPQKGEREFLYCYQNGKWGLAEPPQGHSPSIWTHDELGFLGGNEPVLSQVQYDPESKTSASHLLQLHEGQWQSHPAEKIVQKAGGQIVSIAGEAWVIVARQADGKTSVEGYRITGTRPADTAGPFPLLTLDGSYVIYFADLSKQHRLALAFKETAGPKHEATKKPLLGRIVDLTHWDKPVVETMAAPAIESPFFGDCLSWSPKGELVAMACKPDKVQVFALREGKWTSIAEAKQDRSEGIIFSPRLAFRSDGVPIVTWENFFPH